MENTQPDIRRLDWLDAPIKCDKWKNLYFMTNGQSFLSSLVHPSLEEAGQGARRWIYEYKRDGNNSASDLNGAILARGKISHAIPIPWKG
ncbi:MAG: hypothetical protein ABI612_06135 [Betaproteobacteria bacterium]